MMISHFSRVQLFVILWTVARQVLLSMEFARQEYWMGYGLLFPTPRGIFPTQGSNPSLLSLLHRQVDSLQPRHLGSLY